MSAPEAGTLRLRADREVCIGAGVCVMTAEALFDQDDDGMVMVLEPEPGPEAARKAREAVRNCPSGALSLLEG